MSWSTTLNEVEVGDVTHYVAGGPCRAPVEPAAADVHNDFFGPSTLRFAPQVRDSANRDGFYITPSGALTRSMMASNGARETVPCRRPLLGSTMVPIAPSQPLRWCIVRSDSAPRDQTRFGPWTSYQINSAMAGASVH